MLINLKQEYTMAKHFVFSVFSISLLSLCLLCICESECQTKSAGMQDGVRLMAQSVVRDLHNEGPAAWLKYFSTSNQFFMASNGMLVFPNIDSASSFVPRFAKQIQWVELTWNDIRIDSLTPDFCIMAAYYHESLIGAAGVQDTPSGYFTGVVENTSNGWKFRDAHWSTMNPQH
jgi:uncharacterized protein YbdZ (MbtH family)